MSDDEYEIPLQNQRVFGAGIKRKRVQFVPAKQDLSSSAKQEKSSVSVSDAYLSLVLPRSHPSSNRTSQDSPLDERACEVCHLPIRSEAGDGVPDSSARSHDTSIAHQVCLEHSHPPSHIDRKRKGLLYMQNHGFDVDARKGLGVQAQGIKHPIKIARKEDTLGIGAKLPQGKLPKKKEIKTLDAKKVRKKHEEDGQSLARLRDAFYQSEDVERYLGKT